MSPILRIAVVCLSLAVPTAALAASLSPVGQWEVTSGESRYRVSYCGEGQQLCAKLTWLRDDAKTDENLALLGNYIVRGATPAEDNTWTGTVTYEGQTYDGRVTLVSSDAMRFESCSGIFCRSFELRRR